MKKPLSNIRLSLLQPPALPFRLLTVLSNQYPSLQTRQSLSSPKHTALFLSDITTIMMNTMFNPRRSTSPTVCTAHHSSRPAIVQCLNPPPLHHLHLRSQNLKSSNIKQIPLVRSYFLSQGRGAGT